MSGQLSEIKYAWITGLLLLAWPIGSVGQQRGIVLIDDQSGRPVSLYQDSYALVVGISRYRNGWPSLPGVPDDVRKVQAILKDQGFKVTLVEDPDYEQLQRAFNHFINAHGGVPGHRLLFYFAGHGATLEQAYGGEMGYIVPTDAPLPDADRAGFLAKALDMRAFDLFAKRIQSKHALFLFDSCFSGSIFALSRAVPMNISYKTARPVRQFITSGSKDETVPDQSIFRDQFIEALTGEGDTNNDGYVSGTELGEFLQGKVVNYSHGAQHPQYGKIRDPRLDKGDFVFALAESPLEPTQISKTKDQANKEIFILKEDTLEGMFDRMELALKTADESLFKAQWHPTGYQTNLVGPSGTEGADDFRQGSRKGWYFKPHTDEVRGRGSRDDTLIITCDVVQWRTGRHVDQAFAGVIRYENRWTVLGMGEDLSDVSELIDRYERGKPLQPRE